MNQVKIKDQEYYKELDKKLIMIPLTYDKMFKAVFTKNEDILKEFLILQLHLNMKPEETKITISNVELPSEIKKEYKKTIDVLVYLDDKVISNIEINRGLYNDVKHRNCVYFGKLHGLSLKEGEEAKNLDTKKLYQLNLNANKKDNKFGEDVYKLRGNVDHEPLIENYAIFVKNLEFYHDLYYTKHKKLTKSEMWLVALTAKNFSQLYDILSKILEEDKLNKFMEEVVIMSNEEMILKDWEIKQLDELVEYQTKKHAHERGIEQNKNDIAKKMLKKNINVKDIIEITGLSKEEINNLK